MSTKTRSTFFTVEKASLSFILELTLVGHWHVEKAWFRSLLFLTWTTKNRHLPSRRKAALSSRGGGAGVGSGWAGAGWDGRGGGLEAEPAGGCGCICLGGGTLYQQAPLRKGTYTSLPQTSREMASSGSEAKRDRSEV